MNFAADRDRLVDWIRKQLIGPASSHGQLRGISPLDRYPTGRLFPIVRSEEGIDPASTDDDDDDDSVAPGDDKNVEAVQSTAKRRRYIPPSSVGFSFYARGEVSFQVSCSAVRYKRAGDRDERGQFRGLEYERVVVGGDQEANTFTSTGRVDVLHTPEGDCLAGIDVLWRPFMDGWIITVSLFNKQELIEEGNSKAFAQARVEKSLFEVDLRCFLDTGEVGTYPCVDNSLLNKEEQELELQYKHRHIYAVGHGAAVNWRVEQDCIKEIYSEFVPAIQVPQVTADIGSESPQVLGLAYLASSHNEADDRFYRYERDTWYDMAGRIIFTNSKGLVGVGLPRKGSRTTDDVTYRRCLANSCVRGHHPLAVPLYLPSKEELRQQLEDATLPLADNVHGG